MMFSKIVVNALSLLSSIMIARFFGAHTIGAIGYAFAYAGLFSVIMNLGFGQYLIKLVAQKESLDKAISNILTIKIFLILIYVGFCFVYLRYFSHFDGNRALLKLAMLYFLMQSLYSILESLYTGLQNYFLLMFTQVIPKFIYVILLSGVCFWQMPPEAIAFIMVSEIIFQIIFSLLFLRKKKIKFSMPDILYFKRYIKYTWPIMLITIMGISSGFLNRIVIKKFFNEISLGLLIIAQKLFAVPQFILKPITSLLFPKFCAEVSNTGKFISNFNMITVYFAVIAGFLAIQIIFLTDIGVKLLYGQQFMPASTVVKLYSLCIVARLLFRPYANIIYALEEHHYLAYCGAVSFILRILMYIYFIPDFFLGRGLGLGIKAIPIIEAITWVLPSGIYMLHFAKQRYKKINISKPFFIVLCSYFLAGVGVLLSNYLGIENIYLRGLLNIIIINVLFIFLLFKMKAIDKELLLNKIKDLLNINKFKEHLVKDYKMA